MAPRSHSEDSREPNTRFPSKFRLLLPHNPPLPQHTSQIHIPGCSPYPPAALQPPQIQLPSCLTCHYNHRSNPSGDHNHWSSPSAGYNHRPNPADDHKYRSNPSADHNHSPDPYADQNHWSNPSADYTERLVALLMVQRHCCAAGAAAASWE